MRLRIALFLGVVCVAAVARAGQPVVLSPTEAPKAGRALVAEMLKMRPEQNNTSTGLLRIRRDDGKETIIPVRFDAILAAKDWKTQYETVQNNEETRTRLTVIHGGASWNTNKFRLKEHGKEKPVNGNELMTSFAGSDSWLTDLGLDFLQWPEQRLIRKELRRGQSCDFLESINP